METPPQPIAGLTVGTDPWVWDLGKSMRAPPPRSPWHKDICVRTRCKSGPRLMGMAQLSRAAGQRFPNNADANPNTQPQRALLSQTAAFYPLLFAFPAAVMDSAPRGGRGLNAHPRVPACAQGIMGSQDGVEGTLKIIRGFADGIWGDGMSWDTWGLNEEVPWRGRSPGCMVHASRHPLVPDPELCWQHGQWD